MKRKFRDYQEILNEDLKDAELARLYLNEVLKDEDPHMFLIALKNVMNAQGREMAEVAREAKVSRENLYRILSKKGNPKLTNIISLLNAVGYALAVQPSVRSRSKK